ncbi:MAG TPA: S8 family serine peptidase [Verrucomicrobiota bacterium]|nr:S8 family serine peptidase [Verrucomicrobiota bacterium]
MAAAAGLAKLYRLFMNRSILTGLAFVVLGQALQPAAAPPSAKSFPLQGILPKAETGAVNYLEEHPTYDGRGITVAIFDTGVDPGAPGLQVTSDGRPKIVDVVDGSGSGDVDTSAVREAKDGTLTGLSGRTLKLGGDWQNPGDKWRVGIKAAYELFPGSLVSRLKRERKKAWDKQQRERMAGLQAKLADFDEANPSPKDDKKKERVELQARIDLLEALQKGYDDPGSVYDCVVFNDGKAWRAAVDTDEDGDFTDEKLMTNFRAERQWASFGKQAMMNFALNIYDDGDTLSIVTDVGAHGTHVAGIVAANYPGETELNGLAPGAQIVSVKIGDSRMGSSSMGTGEVRGLIAVLENNCQLINMSYGGPSQDPNDGRLAALYSEIVNKHNVIFVASAGNNGPALSTVGSPGGTTSAIFGIGAYVSPIMMDAQYSLREPLPAIQYTWSSRGPTFDGNLGVDFSAPGGAIAPVSNWTLQGNMQMNGTSMSSPNACGGIALLLSGLKQQNIEWTPHRVRRSIENTAKEIPNVERFAQGRGLLQVDKAFAYLEATRDVNDHDLRFEVTNRSQGGRGIYLREPFNTDQPVASTIAIAPVFHEDADNAAKVAFEMRINLKCDASWVEHPGHMVLMHGGRSFGVEINPQSLIRGMKFSEIVGYNADYPERGAVFRVPITVLKPEIVDTGKSVQWTEDFTLAPGQIERRFLVVPAGATWADVVFRNGEQAGSRRIVMQVVQQVPGQSFSESGTRQYITIGDRDTEIRSFAVTGRRTLEVAIAQYWSSLGKTDCTVDIAFHGIVPDSSRLHIDAAKLVTQVDVVAPFGNEALSPSGSFNTLRKTIRSSESKTRPLTDARDALPGNRRIFETEFTYKFSLSTKTAVTPQPPLALEDQFHESWESLIWMLYDKSKRLIAAGSSGSKSSVNLVKGDYVLKFHVRNHHLDHIKKIKDMPMNLDYKLAKPVVLKFHADPDNALTGGGSFGSLTLTQGNQTRLYIAQPKQLPSTAAPGDLLLGSIHYGQGNSNLIGPGKKPGGYPITLRVPLAKADKKKLGADKKKDERTEREKLAEAVRDLKVARLAKLHGGKQTDDFDRLAKTILAGTPNHLPVLVEQLRRLDSEVSRKNNLEKITVAADTVIAQIDTQALASHYGVKLKSDDEEAKAKRVKLDKKLNTLMDALYRKGRALDYIDTQLREVENAGADETKAKLKALDEQFEANFDELQKWGETTDDKFVLLHIRRETRHNRLASALNFLNEKIKRSPHDKKLHNKRIRLLGELGWGEWQAHETQWQIRRFPADYQPF